MHRFATTALFGTLGLLLLTGAADAAQYISVGVSPQDPVSTSGQPAPFGTAVTSIGQVGESSGGKGKGKPHRLH